MVTMMVVAPLVAGRKVLSAMGESTHFDDFLAIAKNLR